MSQDVIAELAPTGVLRAGINMSNFLLVTGKAANGDPDGVSPDMAREAASRLGVPVKLIAFKSPGELADAAEAGAWDIGLIGAEPQRAEKIAFSPAYVEIEATYLVPEGSTFQTVEDVDSAGTRIAVSGRSAYDLYLTRTLKHAELVRAEGLPAAAELFKAEKLDALAGLRPALNDNAQENPGSRVLDGRYTSVQQALGCRPGREAGLAFLKDFVTEARSSGLVQTLIDKHGVTGRLQVAAD